MKLTINKKAIYIVNIGRSKTSTEISNDYNMDCFFVKISRTISIGISKIIC